MNQILSDSQPNPTIAVVGMHRSGTSLLCNLLRASGVYFGQESDFVKPNTENPKGFWEHILFRRANDIMLRDNAADWMEISKFSRRLLDRQPVNTDAFEKSAGHFLSRIGNDRAGSPMGIKDPRLCLLLPFWKPILGPQTLYVLVCRHPSEIAKSLVTRNGFDRRFSHWLTEHYQYHAIENLRDEPLVITSFRKLIADPKAEIIKIRERFESLTGQALKIDDSELETQVDPGLYRSVLRQNETSAPEVLIDWLHSLERDERLPTDLRPPSAPTVEVALMEHDYRFREWKKAVANYSACLRVSQELADGMAADAIDWSDAALTHESRAALKKIRSDQIEGQERGKELQADLESAKSEWHDLKAERDKLAGDLESTKSAWHDLQAEHNSIASDLDRVKEKQIEDEARLAQLEADLDAASKERQSLSAALTEKRRELELATAKAEAMSSELASLQSSLSDRLNELAFAQDVIEEQKSQIAEADQSAAEARAALAAKNQLIAEERATNAADRAAADEEILRLKRTLKWAQGRLNRQRKSSLSERIQVGAGLCQNQLTNILEREEDIKRALVGTNAITERLASSGWAVSDTLAQIESSRSWRVVSPWLRLLMSPKNLGRNGTSIETLNQQLAALRASVNAAVNRERSRLPIQRLDDSPLIAAGKFRGSVIVLNRDGSEHLENLFASHVRQHKVNAFQWIVIDHASRDDSVDVIRNYMQRVPIRLLSMTENQSFAYSNNLGALFADAEHLIFCNNDIIFDEPVLGRLVDELKDERAGLVGLHLFYPTQTKQRSEAIQHAGIDFRYDSEFDFPRPYNIQDTDKSSAQAPIAAVTAALAACRKQDFYRLGGFDEGYDYGYEDVDLSLSVANILGLEIRLLTDAAAIHDESASQRKDNNDRIVARRRSNIAHFRERFGQQVMRERLLPRLLEEQESQDFQVGIVVTDDDPNTLAGDFFTATELAEALERELGWSVRYLPRLSKSKDWYDCEGLDAVIALLDVYDLTKIRNAKPTLLKIGWLRNWFQRWAERPWFNGYDLAFCSSEFAARWIADHSAVETAVYPIATNPDTFRPDQSLDDTFVSDYCFTGSYWGAPREIEGFEPDKIPYRFALYGHGWDEHEQFANSYRGSIPYSDIHKVYGNTKILIDDANHVTKPWGSVNSRVFDALAAGVLVITNGALGASETFDGLLPTWESPEDLAEKLEYFLENDQERIALTEQLRHRVISHHTYGRRAVEFGQRIHDYNARPRIAIKLPVPKWEIAPEWGDYHFGSSLANAFRAMGFRVRLDVLSDWYRFPGLADDVVIVLRGLSRYEPDPAQLNIMWNISHPDKVSDEEYESYDHVFVASILYARRLAERLKVPVTPLLQCTDHHRFRPESHWEKTGKVLFVGNSRNIARPIVMNAIECGVDLEVYGTRWETFIDERFLKGEHIPNQELSKAYGTAGVVLNDHWESMRQLGFISNRLFDAAASGARIVTDPVEGIGEIFGDSVYQCAPDFGDLRKRIETALVENTTAIDIDKAIEFGRKHSFAERAKSIAEIIETQFECPGSATRPESPATTFNTAGSPGD